MRRVVARLDPVSTFVIVVMAVLIAAMLAAGCFTVRAMRKVDDSAARGDLARAHAIEHTTFLVLGGTKTLIGMGLILLGWRAIRSSRQTRSSEARYRSLFEASREAQAALERSRRHYRELADALPQPVFEANADGILTFANRAALETFGYAELDVARGYSLSSMVAPKDRERAGRNVCRRLGGELEATSEYEMQRSDGSTFPAVVYSEVIRREGRIAGLRGIIVDNSARKQEEQRLRERLLFEKAVAQATSLLVSEGEAELDLVAKAIGQTVSVGRVHIVRLEDGGASIGEVHQWPKDAPQLGDGQFRLLAEAAPQWWTTSLGAGDEIIIPDVAALPDDQSAQRDALSGLGVRALMVAPIQSASGALAGVVALSDLRCARTWHRDDARLLRLIAQRLAIYWQRRHAEQEMRLTNARLELLNMASQRLNMGEPLADAIQASCDELRELFGYDYVELFLLASGGETVSDEGLGTIESVTPPTASCLAGETTPLIGHSRRSRRYGGSELSEFHGREQILQLVADLAPPGEEGMADLAPRICDILGVSYVCQIPLLCDGVVVGHLAVGLTDDRGLPDREKRFLEQFGEQLGLIVAKGCAETALRESEQRYRVLFNSGGDAIFVLRPGDDGRLGQFIAVNDTACSRLGYSREELLRMSPADVDHPDYEAPGEDVSRQLQAEGHAVFEVVHRTRIGEAIPVELSTHLFSLDGCPTILAVARDITERKRHEERLRKVNECFLGFGADPAENIDALIALCGDVLGADWTAYVRGCTGSIQVVSGWRIPQGCSCPSNPHGLICYDILTSSNSDVISLGDLQDSEYAAVDPNVNKLGARSYLGKIVRPHDGADGAVCAFFRRDFQPSEAEHRLMGIIAGAIRVEEERQSARDDRERALLDLKSLNRDLERARAEAEEANRLKSEFLANTSHEIRTPLNGIIGYLQLVLNGLSDSPEEEREFLEGAAESARHLLSLINDVLDIAKIEAGKLRIELEPTNVASLLAEVHSMVRVHAQRQGLELVVHPAADELVAWCDPERLKQVLINLLGNAVKFTPTGGAVTVATTSREREGTILLEVSDTGVGIAPEQLDSIFEKFVQGDGSTTRERGGSGLGLTISRRLVELMGGAMGVHSDGVGKGATFFFTVPLHRPQQETPWAGAGWGAPPADDERPLVLVVEDDPLYREYLRELLDKCGCATMWAMSADDAALALEHRVPRAITIDYSLPAREGARLNTGWDLLAWLQQDQRFARTATILVTGDPEVLGRRLRIEGLPASVAVVDKRDVPTKLASAIEARVTRRTVCRAPRLMLVDDDPDFCRVMGRLLEACGYELEVVGSGQDCLSLLEREPDAADLLLLDLRMPGVDGYEVLRRLRLMDGASDLPVLVVTAHAEPTTLQEKAVLAAGGMTRVLTKQEVIADPSALCRVIGQFVPSAPRTRSSDGPADAGDQKAHVA